MPAAGCGYNVMLLSGAADCVGGLSKTGTTSNVLLGPLHLLNFHLTLLIAISNFRALLSLVS